MFAALGWSLGDIATGNNINMTIPVCNEEWKIIAFIMISSIAIRLDFLDSSCKAWSTIYVDGNLAYIECAMKKIRL